MDIKRGKASMATASKIKLQDCPIIKITWIDAQADAGWDEPKVDIAHCVTVGFLVGEDDEAICVAGTVSDHECNNRISIPKSWIITQQLEETDETTVSKSKGKKPTKVGSGATTKKVSTTTTRRPRKHVNGSRRGRCQAKSGSKRRYSVSN